MSKSSSIDTNEVISASGQPSTQSSTQTTPWHMAFLGDIDAIWEDYTGEGITVAVYDDGVEYTHEDLAENYDASQHATVGGAEADPFPVRNAAHGTAVAGLIGAADNGIGTIGVAHGSTLVGVNIFDGPAGAQSGFEEVLGQLGDYDLSNHSWGWAPSFQGNGLGEAEAAALFDASIVTGRDGLGAINLKAAGNDDLNANGELAQVGRSTIIVGAYDDTGDASWYSNYGANLLISSPSNGGVQGLETTDRSGFRGYDRGSDYTDDFGGTSGATPIAAGVVALMLDANPDLGWRDVQKILAYSATEVGSGVGGVQTADENHEWFMNGATDWNGGGLHFSEDYGFGAVNVFNAVRLAEVWDLFDEAQTSENEASMSDSAAGGVIADGGVFEAMLEPGESVFTIEYVDVTVEMVHDDYSSIVIELISDTGTVVELFDGTDGEVGARFGGSFSWTYGATAFQGEMAGEEWTVRVTDTDGSDGDTGAVTGVSVTWYGSDEDVADDVHHVTDEFSEFFTGSTISDTNGGEDWINAAAVSDKTRIDLRDGKSSTIDGVSVEIEGVENAVTGDGDDWMSGDGGANELHGMRGDDILSGRGGDDKLNGGDGDDTIRGQNGRDVAHGGAGSDTFIDGKGNDAYYGEEGDDLYVFQAKRGNDVLHDFESGDSIDISSFGISDGAGDEDWLGAAASVSQSGDDALISWAGGGSLRIKDTELSELSDADFTFV